MSETILVCFISMLIISDVRYFYCTLHHFFGSTCIVFFVGFAAARPIPTTRATTVLP